MSAVLVALALLIVGHPGSAVRPVVTFTPNWENILSGDKVTLTCDAGSAASEDETYYWYKENDPLGINKKNITIPSASWADIGDYQCHTSVSDISRPIRLYISQAALILQRPPSIHEGQSLTLRCHSRPGYNVINATFYKEDKEIQFSTTDSELRIRKVDGGVSGKYRCSKVVEDGGSINKFSYESYIHVSRVAVSPVVTFIPNWRNVLSGDTVTINCTVVSDDQEKQMYYWYKDEKPAHRHQQSFTIKSASWKDVGDYRCSTKSSDISAPVKLSVINAALVLQRPQDILEGDSLTLRCHSRSEYRVTSTIFYKDDTEIQSSVDDSLLHIDKVDGAMTGKYKCTKMLQDYDGTLHTVTDESYVSVRELFSQPKIKAPSYQITEDDNLTLTCIRRLNPLRDGTELKFAFYKNGQQVQNFSSSDIYRVQSTQLEDSGNYTCEVITPIIRKMSDVLNIHVRELFSHPEIEAPPYILLGRHLTLTCVTKVNPLRLGTEMYFTFYRNGWKVQEFRSVNMYRIQSAQLEDSGNYTCEVWTMSGPTRKMSNISYIHIQDYTYQNILRLVLSVLTLMAAAGIIVYDKHSQCETSGDDE